jgi:hypothetical protein
VAARQRKGEGPPELPLGRDDKVLIKRIGMGGDLDPLAAASDDRQRRAPGRGPRRQITKAATQEKLEPIALARAGTCGSKMTAGR